MIRNIALCIFLLLQLVANGQSHLIEKHEINIKKTPYWPKISNNDTLLSQYAYLNSLNFYFLRYQSDSFIINGFIIEPKVANHLPVVIYNRGGNRNIGSLNFAFLVEELAPIAGAGYIIIASQYRGSLGISGKDEFGGADVQDVLNLIPVINELPEADTSRIGMYGWSRGGMMTYLTLCKTTKIKTAIIGGGPTDLFQWIEQRPEMEKVYLELIPGYAANKGIVLQNRSAIFWPEKLCSSTSFLLLHGSNDERVGVNQSVEMARKLREYHFKTEIKIFEGADHGNTQYKTEMEQVILAWLKQNL